jgi:hypothetical protein
MERELRNGDLVRVPPENLSTVWAAQSNKNRPGLPGLLGIVIDDIDANEEVQIMYAGSTDTGWWNVESLELISDGGGEESIS